MMSLHIDSTVLPYTLQSKNLYNVPLINSVIHIFPCLGDTDTKRYHRMTLGVTNFEKRQCSPQKIASIFIVLCSVTVIIL